MVVVIAALLLCLFGVVAAGVVYYLRFTESVEPTEPTEVVGPVDPDWTVFSPEPYDPAAYAEPTTRQLDLAEEITAAHFPSFVVEQVVVQPGYTEDDMYYSDTLIVDASLQSDPPAHVVTYYYTQTEEAIQAGSTWDTGQLSMRETLGVTSDGTQYTWYAADLAPVQPSDTSAFDLLSQVAADFPGCVVFYMDVGEDTATLKFTTWEGYLALDAFAVYFSAKYVPGADGWEYVTSIQTAGGIG